MKPSIGIVLFICFLLGCSPAEVDYSKWEVSDLLELLEDEDLSPKNHIEVLNELAFQVRNSSRNEARDYATKALGLAQEHNYKKGRGDAYVRLGLISRLEGEVEQAKIYYIQALEIRKELEVKRDIASVYLNLGTLLKKVEREQAIQYYKTGLKLIEKEPDPTQRVKFLNNLGNIYAKDGHYQEAVSYLEEALSIRKELNVPEDLVKTYLALGNFNLEVNNYKQASNYFNQVLDIYSELDDTSGIAEAHLNLGSLAYKQKDFDAAFIFYQQAKNLVAYLSEEQQTILSSNLASIYNVREDRQKALAVYEEALNKIEQGNTQVNAALIHYNIGRIQLENEAFLAASTHFEKALLLAQQQNQILLQKDVLLDLISVYEHLESPQKAYHYSKEHNILQDSLYQNLQKATNLESDIKKEQQARLEAQLKTQNTMIICGILAFVLLFGVAGAIVYFKEQKKQIAYLRIDELLIEKELTANYARLEEQEKERNRIAQDLHDRLGSMLSVVKLSLGTINAKIEGLQEESKTQYAKANKLLDEACEEVRNISHGLKNSILAKFGLKAALESFIDSLSGNDLKVELSTHNIDNRLENKIEINVFRIIQELVSNTLKHAKASRLVIQVNRFEDLLNVTVEDNGIGFNPEQLNEKKAGLGLHNIEARVHDLDGSFNIDSGKGNGTTTMIDIPC